MGMEYGWMNRASVAQIEGRGCVEGCGWIEGVAG